MLRCLPGSFVPFFSQMVPSFNDLFSPIFLFSMNVRSANMQRTCQYGVSYRQVSSFIFFHFFVQFESFMQSIYSFVDFLFFDQNPNRRMAVGRLQNLHTDIDERFYDFRRDARDARHTCTDSGRSEEHTSELQSREK